jgi:hypothetical protein
MKKNQFSDENVYPGQNYGERLRVHSGHFTATPVWHLYPWKVEAENTIPNVRWIYAAGV